MGECVVCLERPAEEGCGGMCFECGEANARFNPTWDKPRCEDIAWAAKRARTFERRRHAKRKAKP